MDEAPRITAEALKRRLDAGEDVVVLDMRRRSWELSEVKIPGARRMEPNELLDAEAKLRRDTAVVAYCT